MTILYSAVYSAVYCSAKAEIVLFPTARGENNLPFSLFFSFLPFTLLLSAYYKVPLASPSCTRIIMSDRPEG